MKSFKFIILVSLLPYFLFCQIDYASPEEEGLSSNKIDKVSLISERIVDENKVSNITTIINRNGKIVYFKSFGKRGFSYK